MRLFTYFRSKVAIQGRLANVENACVEYMQRAYAAERRLKLLEAEDKKLHRLLEESQRQLNAANEHHALEKDVILRALDGIGAAIITRTLK